MLTKNCFALLCFCAAAFNIELLGDGAVDERAGLGARAFFSLLPVPRFDVLCPRHVDPRRNSTYTIRLKRKRRRQGLTRACKSDGDGTKA